MMKNSQIIKQLRIVYLQYQLLILPISAGFIGIIIIIAVIIPQLFGYLKLIDQLGKLKKQNYALEAKAAKLEAIDSASSARDLAVILTSLPAEPAISEAFVALENLVKKSGLLLDGARLLSAPSSTATGGSFRITGTTSGPIESVRAFLINLHNTTRIFQLESFEVAARGAGVEANFVIKVFYEAAPTSLGSLEQPVPELTQAEKDLLAKLTLALQPEVVSEAQGGVPGTDIGSVELGKINPFE